MILASNSEIDGVVSSMTSLEQRFNKHFQYPYVFLNDVEFDENFKAQVSKHTKAKIEFGRIPKEAWGFPEWIDPDKAREAFEAQRGKIIYGGLESYHHMCRFFSASFSTMNL